MEAEGEMVMKEQIKENKILKPPKEPISARKYKTLTSKQKKELKIAVEESGEGFDEYIARSERLFPKGGKKNPITWRKI